jgi:hypothetical protein
MDSEKEKVLTEVKQVRNVRNAKGKLVQRAKRYLTKAEREDRETQVNRMKAQLRQPAWVNDALGGNSPQTLAKGIRAIEDDLEENSPPQLSAPTRDALLKRQRELREKIKDGMLTHEEMRRNPPGAVDRHRRWEKQNTDRILEYKNVCRALEPDSDAKDLASVEVFRPSRPFQYNSNSQIAGHFAYSDVPQENWDQTFGKKDRQATVQDSSGEDKL